MDTKQFFPVNSQTRDAGFTNKDEFFFESLKAYFEADADVLEGCLNMCNVDFKTGANIETKCLTKCYQKYLNSALSIKKSTEFNTFVLRR